MILHSLAPGGNLRDVAVKIQHPGVIDSAFMDLNIVPQLNAGHLQHCIECTDSRVWNGAFNDSMLRCGKLWSFRRSSYIWPCRSTGVVNLDLCVAWKSHWNLQCWNRCEKNSKQMLYEYVWTGYKLILYVFCCYFLYIQRKLVMFPLFVGEFFEWAFWRTTVFQEWLWCSDPSTDGFHTRSLQPATILGAVKCIPSSHILISIHASWEFKRRFKQKGWMSPPIVMCSPCVGDRRDTSGTTTDIGVHQKSLLQLDSPTQK